MAIPASCLVSSGSLPVNIKFRYDCCYPLHSLRSLEVTLDIIDPDAAKNLGFGQACHFDSF